MSPTCRARRFAGRFQERPMKQSKAKRQASRAHATPTLSRAHASPAQASRSRPANPRAAPTNAAPGSRHVLRPGEVRPRPPAKNSQAHGGVAPLNPVTHRNVSFQPLPRPLGLAPYHYDIAQYFPDIAANIQSQ